MPTRILSTCFTPFYNSAIRICIHALYHFIIQSSWVWAPVSNKPAVSVDVKLHFNNFIILRLGFEYMLYIIEIFSAILKSGVTGIITRFRMNQWRQVPYSCFCLISGSQSQIFASLRYCCRLLLLLLLLLQCSWDKRSLLFTSFSQAVMEQNQSVASAS